MPLLPSSASSPSPRHNQPVPAILLTYEPPELPAPKSPGRVALGALGYAGQYLLGLVSAPAWTAAVWMLGGHVLSTNTSTSQALIFLAVVLGAYVVTIGLAAWKLELPVLVPGAITGLLAMPLLGGAFLIWSIFSACGQGLSRTGSAAGGGH